jgi:type 1 glutamine amidotransferase
MKYLFAFSTLLLACTGMTQLSASQPSKNEAWVVYEGKGGPGKGKHIVFVTGDEEYRSEESMPQLAKILAVRHGFKCTVLFAIDKKNGAINPQQLDNIPGLEQLEKADLMVIFTRFRNLPDEQMKFIVEYTNSGKPILGLRTATHAFSPSKQSKFAMYHWQAGKEFPGGFGRQVLGETWVAHYGAHQKESTRGVVAEGMEKNPLVRGLEDLWGPSDVYALKKLTGDSQPIIMGQVLKGMKPTDEPAPGKKLVPITWIKSYTGETGKKARVFATTMGHGGDLVNEGVRRMLVNGVFWCLEMEQQIPERANVAIVGEYKPSNIGVGGHKKNVRPADLRLTEP